MNDSEFQRFCYQEYARSGSRLNEVYGRYPFAATLLVVLTGAAYGVGTNDHWSDFLLRFDVTLYYAALVGAFGAIAVSATALMLSVLPKSYSELGTATGYLRWRRDYRKELEELGQFSEADMDNAVAKQTEMALCERLASAVDANNASTKQRTRFYNGSIYAVSGVVPLLAIAAVLRWAIEIRETLS